MSVSVWTLAEIDEKIAALKQLHADVATANKTVMFNGRTYSRRDLDEITKQLEYFRIERQKLTGEGGLQIVTGVAP